MEEVKDNSKTSIFNSGLKIIERLHGLRTKANNYSCSGRYKDWNNVLDRLWCELARDLEENKFKDQEKKFNDIEKELAKLGELLNDFDSKGFSSPTDEDIKNRNKQYKILMIKDLFLGRLENSLGKGSKWEDESEDDWE